MSIKLSDTQILQNLETARASKLSLVNQVKNAYYALLLAEDSRKVLLANYETSKVNAEVFTKKHEIGVASEYDMLRANVAVTNLEPSIIDAENSINKLKLQLKLLMAMDANVDFSTSESLEGFKTAMYGRAMTMDTSLVNNTSVKQLDLQTDLLRQTLDVQKASWLPTIAATANLGYSSMTKCGRCSFPGGEETPSHRLFCNAFSLVGLLNEVDDGGDIAHVDFTVAIDVVGVFCFVFSAEQAVDKHSNITCV